MQSKENFIKEINAVIENNGLLKHPFYQKWNEGNLTKESLREYAKQYYHFVKHFPRFVSSVHSNCADIEVRKILLENLAAEEGYKTGMEDHPKLWVDFTESLGLTEQEIKMEKPIKEVEMLVERMYSLTRSEKFCVGLAALYAYECQVPQISKTKIEGLNKFYGINNKEAIKFFTVHEEADVYHSQDEINIIFNETKTSEDKKMILNAAGESSKLMWNFLDGVYQNYCAA